MEDQTLNPVGKTLEKTGRTPRWKVILLGLLIVSVSVGWYAYKSIRLRPLKSEMASILASSSALSESLVQPIASESSLITMGEITTLCERNVAHRQELASKLRSLHPDIRYDLREEAIQFINAETELDRAFRQVFEREVAHLSALRNVVSYGEYMLKNNLTTKPYRDRFQELQNSADGSRTDLLERLATLENLYDEVVGAEQAFKVQVDKAGIPFTGVWSTNREAVFKDIKESRAAAAESLTE